VAARTNVANEDKVILDYLMIFGQDTGIGIESTFSWYWLYHLLNGSDYDAVILTPTKTKCIASVKIKNDKVVPHLICLPSCLRLI